MQVLLRSTTSARPRAASPGSPVSDWGIASPTIAYVRNAAALAAQGRVATAARHAPRIWMAGLAKGIHRDRLEPGLRIVGVTRAHLARRIDRAGAAGFDLGECAVPGLVGAGLREGVAGCDRTVAGAEQLWRRRGRACDQARHRGGACLGFGIRSRWRFRDDATRAGRD